ncbi:hypothetical protein uav_174 [Pseudomonas phage UAVern]|uniref:Uncharacterized protein n=1 Tax=Pseudomonas phage UAVern TaxID=2856997 RepID=A0A975YYM5_9CAUD|nr:hypothetical protein uav_174 [Pseudomonas phage UAVern]
MIKTREMMEATHKRFSDDDWELDVCEVCGLSGTHKMSCPERYVVEGYCIAGDNCMCAEEIQRAGCLDWKQQA